MDPERCLKEQGLTWTWEQIRTCWKKLKKRFMAERLLLCKSGGEPSKGKWFDKLSLLLGDRPMVQARDYGVDTAAEDEDIVLLCAEAAKHHRILFYPVCSRPSTARLLAAPAPPPPCSGNNVLSGPAPGIRPAACYVCSLGGPRFLFLVEERGGASFSPSSRGALVTRTEWK
ncbi:hypothetical protein HPB51_025921 [Rhipicephalus microplus]|uniref:Uncharacterized protein n=1 Tax=Rhipicephalus microplus TaxID=6941 RepID=A0A9J6EDP9_RHIMP|nr:hypothetical protein HPB51_025921 [Rhipicephalus microplus]